MASSATGFNEGTAAPTKYGRIGTARGSAINAYYKFDGTVTDSSGNDLTLTLDAGTIRYCMIRSLQALACKGGLHLVLSAADSSTIQQTGARTVHVLICPDTVTDSATSDLIYVVGRDSGDTENLNTTAQLAIMSYEPVWTSEHGGGLNDDMILAGYSFIQGVPILITVTRDASGEVQFYFNGTAVGSRFTDDAPTGGGDAELCVGGFHGTSAYDYTGAIAELQFLDIELTAAQVLEDAKKVMPWL